MRLQIVFIALISVHLTIAIEPCLTPKNEPGDCKPIERCPSINAYFTRGMPISLGEQDFLRKSKCGSVYRSWPKVCCPIDKTTSKTHLFPNPDECGLNVENKIVGGVGTDLEEFPWMALLLYKLRDDRLVFRCGGALINRRYVLTARHCLISGLVSVRLGEHDVRTDPDCTRSSYGNDCADRVIDIPIEEMIPYTDTSIEKNDIGLVRLSKEVDYSDYVKPVCLPMAPYERTKSYIGESFVVAGWGFTKNKTFSNVKLKVRVPVKPLADCDRALKSLSKAEFNLHQGQICAGGEKGKDSCNGDSGGPLMGLRRSRDGELHWNVFGIVSLGPTNPCGQEDKPAVYVRVANYIDWIMENVKE